MSKSYLIGVANHFEQRICIIWHGYELAELRLYCTSTITDTYRCLSLGVVRVAEDRAKLRVLIIVSIPNALAESFTFVVSLTGIKAKSEGEVAVLLDIFEVDPYCLGTITFEETLLFLNLRSDIRVCKFASPDRFLDAHP